MLFLVSMLYALVNILVSHVGTISCLPGLNQYIELSYGDSMESSHDETILLNDIKHYFGLIEWKECAILKKKVYILDISR